MTPVAKATVALLLVGLLGLALWAGWSVISRRQDAALRSQVIAPVAEASGFARADGPRPLEFPADHGPHPDFQTEWWYYTGNLETDDGRRFGYQLTFFRRALVPPPVRQERPSDWATDQLYLAHFALTDVAGGRHHAFERFSRGAAGLAGAAAPPYRVWIDDWRVDQVGDDEKITQMQAAQEDIAINLRLIDRKGPVLQGERGYSQKGPEPGNASYYYSHTRLETSGIVRVGQESFEVGGWSWMDHEFSTSALGSDQVGWDWFALQFDDGTELMVAQIRKSDGSIDQFSAGTLIDAAGSARHLSPDDFIIEFQDTWRSPSSGATYPSRWTIDVPSADMTLTIEPYVADQELNVSYTYWEGAVRIEGVRSGNAVTGHGYVEMTGYAGSMRDQF